MRHFIAPDSTRVVFDLTEPPVYETVQEDSILTIFLKQTTCAGSIPQETKLRKSGIETITITTMKEEDVRVQIKLKSDIDVHVNVFNLKPFQDRPDRLVIDVELPEVSRKETHLREQAKVSKKKKIIILDPGHGGDDPGAVGGRGTYEKDVVLAISRHIKKLLDRHGLFQTYLTRDGDYYVSFDKRLRIAREYGADLFISVHADAAKNREARGSSVYCLSTGETSSVAAKTLAQSENLADIAGGVQKTETTDISNPILINMYQTNTINISKNFGMIVLGELERVGELKFKKVQEAPFIVLRMPEIPSVLIETAFISNAEEEKKLRQPVFREEIAAAVARAVIKFFASSSPNSGQDERKEKSFLYYTVGKGDTLTNIAARFGLSLQTLLRDNDLNIHAPLHIGRQLKIEINELSIKERNVLESPARKSGTEKSPGTETKNRGANTAPRYYTVEKGDTLIKIAERFGVTVQNLLEDNKLRKDDPLHVGKRLKINTREKGARENTLENRSSGRAVATKPPLASESTKGAKKKVSYYTVQRGDSLTKIAERFGITVKELLDGNGMKINDPLHVGRRLKIEKEEPPAKVPLNQKRSSGKSGEKQKVIYKTYQVKKGDRLLDIAQKHDIPVSVLLKANNMKLNDPLHVGRILRIGPVDAP